VLLRAGRAAATPLPGWLPSDASSADRPLGNGSGKSCAASADGVYSFLASELHSVESLSLCPEAGRVVVDWLVRRLFAGMPLLRAFVRFGAVLDLYM
jgi:hypothetical protein